MKFLIALALALGVLFPAQAVEYPPSTITIQLGEGQAVKVDRRKTNTSANVFITVNQNAIVNIIQPPPTTKVCANGSVIPIDQTCPPQTQTCWDGSVIPVDQTCPPQTKVCWNGSTIPVADACPVQTQTCWDGSVVPIDQTCPPQPPPTQTCWDGTIIPIDETCPPAPPPLMISGLQADLTAIPASTFTPGTMEMRVKDTTEVAPPGNGDGSAGAFRVVCGITRLDYDDPIVHFGKPKQSHLHTFVCNAGVDAFSTLETLMAAPSAARGGIANRSSYWVTTLIDMRTMRPVLGLDWLTYYKTGQFGRGYGWKDAAGVWQEEMNADGTRKFPGWTNPPNGLKMVAGDPMRMAPRTNSEVFDHRWTCSGAGLPNVYGSAIPQCFAGQTLVQEVFFPNCWDGVNLDSPNHKSHMSYPVGVKNTGDSRGWSHRECPATHPKVLPEISFSIHFPVATDQDTPNWRLSADSDLTLPAGIRSHGDVFVVWDEGVKEAWMTGCIRANKDCHAHLLGDGRALYGPP